MHHPEVGDFDLVWGKEGDASKKYAGGYGLAKLIAKHPEVVDHLQEFVSSLSAKEKNSRNIYLESEDGKAGIRLDFNGKAKRWLVTAFIKKEALEAAKGGTPSVTEHADPAPNGPAGQEASNVASSVPQEGSDDSGDFGPIHEQFYHDAANRNSV